MSDILIRGMEMPKNCKLCKLYVKPACCYLRDIVHLPEYTDPIIGKRHEHCPLIEVPTPHSRLIDADALMTEFMDSDLDHLQRDDWREVIQIVQDAPTIIEAEGSEE